MSNKARWRQAFENYIKDGPDDVLPDYDAENDCYHWTQVDNLWRCWKAAQESAIANKEAA